ncbi:HD domain-containing protein [Nocardia takedensis]
MSDPNSYHSVIRFAHEAGRLKTLPRTGWQIAGIAHPESVADHSYRVGILAYVIAVLEGLPDPDRAATLGLFHDLPECRLGDIPAVGRAYITAADPGRVVADQTVALPAPLADGIQAIIDEHESAKRPDATPAARCSRDADKLDCLLQAREYETTGNRRTDVFVRTMLDALTTPTAKALGQAALEVDPAEWWTDFSSRISTLGTAGQR